MKPSIAPTWTLPAPRTVLKATLTVTLALGLSACSVLPQAESVTTYVLQPAPTPPSATAPSPLPGSLRVVRPQGHQGAEGRRVTVLEGGRRLTSYQGLRWSSAAPELWRDFLIESMRGDARFPSVSSDEQTLRADLELHSTLLAFQAESGEAGEPMVVRLRLDAQLVDGVSRKILASQRFEAAVPTPSDAPSVMTAFNRVAQQTALEVKAWLASPALRGVGGPPPAPSPLSGTGPHP